MFGRIPRLPVDVMFKSVLHDPVVADFSSYSKTLLTYLSEAARIAQQHSTKEQEHQARQYNKKVKGVSLQVGDRVLLANKGERGKKNWLTSGIRWSILLSKGTPKPISTRSVMSQASVKSCTGIYYWILTIVLQLVLLLIRKGHRLFLSLTLKYLTPLNTDMTDHSQTYPDMTMMLRFEVE
ncbi:hypothetical protein AAFF_G00119140 [Aldrovandia affinis]|uniref:Uncharacterized protein n=1 Tax=Aldrovandia affinis TaxID=143900 RepID=A0AAD7RSE3_9TELE|nr:hypothetical protein AAFF_G00119140 [Aldrovandia affinis]